MILKDITIASALHIFGFYSFPHLKTLKLDLYESSLGWNEIFRELTVITTLENLEISNSFYKSTNEVQFLTQLHFPNLKVINFLFSEFKYDFHYIQAPKLQKLYLYRLENDENLPLDLKFIRIHSYLHPILNLEYLTKLRDLRIKSCENLLCIYFPLQIRKLELGQIQQHILPAIMTLKNIEHLTLFATEYQNIHLPKNFFEYLIKMRERRLWYISLCDFYILFRFQDMQDKNIQMYLLSLALHNMCLSVLDYT